jgi:ribosomal protein L30/L7E
MIRLGGDLPPQQKTAALLRLKSAIEGLEGKIPSLKAMEVGLNISKRPSASDLVLISLFDDPAGLDAYRVHPAHAEVLEMMRLMNGEAVVVDYEC